MNSQYDDDSKLKSIIQYIVGSRISGHTAHYTSDVKMTVFKIFDHLVLRLIFFIILILLYLSSALRNLTSDNK